MAAAPVSVPLAERAGGPDLARGLALLGIGLANIVGWLHGSDWTVLLKQSDATAADRAVDVLIALLADNRGFPLFALLFGYGIGILHRRSRERGERTRRFLGRMARRHLVLLAIGLAHAIFLFSGDILVPYAVIGMLCALLMTGHRALLPLTAVLALPSLGLWGWADATIGLRGGTGYASASAPDYLTGLELRTLPALRGALTAPITDLGLLTPMALGALAARQRLFEEVPANRSLLAPLTRWGLGIGVLGAVPLTVVLLLGPVGSGRPAPVLLGILGVLHQYSGVVFALGLAAGTALLAQRVLVDGRGPRLPGAAVRGVAALGAVSLSAYISQSLVFAAVFPSYTLDLGAELGTAGAATIVLLLWLLMIPLAAALRRRGRRGPLESLLRRMAGSSTPRQAAEGGHRS